VVGEDDGAVCAFAACHVLDFFYDGFFAFAGVDYDVCAVVFGEFEAFVAGVDADDF